MTILSFKCNLLLIFFKDIIEMTFRINKINFHNLKM